MSSIISVTDILALHADQGVAVAEITVEEDGLPSPEVGGWAEEKYRLVRLYDELFSTGMKNKWEIRAYIDLYAGPGFARVRGTNRLLLASPLLALGVPDQFDQYIFCETDRDRLSALEQRVRRDFPSANVRYILGDCNDRVDEVCGAIPSYSKDRRVLSFCFVDPFDLSPKFATVRKLSFYCMDFLFLLALHMDANRNLEHYLAPDNTKVEDFLGLSDWRERWKVAEGRGVRFPGYLAEEYSKQMENSGYLPMPWHKMRQVRSNDKNLPLYRLALFSRHALAYELWDQVLKYSSDQGELFEG